MSFFSKTASTIIRAVTVSTLLTATTNFVADPYGAFGDKFINMPNYSVKFNQKIPMTEYLDKNYGKFNTYVIGGSKAGSLFTSHTNEAFKKENVKAYNFTNVGGVFYTYETSINYMIDNYKPKKIILHLSTLDARNYKNKYETINNRPHYLVEGSDPLDYYDTFLSLNLNLSINKLEIKNNQKEYEIFTKDGFQIEYGERRKPFLEEKIREKGEEYYRAGSSPEIIPGIDMTNLDSLQRIVDKCKNNNVDLLVIAGPTSNKEFQKYERDKLKEYLIKMAEITPYWNFTGYNDESWNNWNFIDMNHYRSEIGQMMLTKITEVQTGKVSYTDIPENFGVYVTPDNVNEEMERAFTKPAEIVADENKPESQRKYFNEMGFGINRWE